MYESVKKNVRQRRDRTLAVLIAAAVLLSAAVAAPTVIAVNASRRYHRFVRDFAHELVAARQTGAIMLLENGESGIVTADAVSSMFAELTDRGPGKPLKEPPDAPFFTLKLPDGTTLTLYDTPQEHEDGIPRGAAVRFVPAEGKPFLYLQRDVWYQHMASAVRSGLHAPAESN